MTNPKDAQQLLQQYQQGERNFPGVELCNADLTGAWLSGVNLQGAVLSGAVLVGANLSGQLQGASLTGALLNRANLSGVDLRGASILGSGKFLLVNQIGLLYDLTLQLLLVMQMVFLDHQGFFIQMAVQHR